MTREERALLWGTKIIWLEGCEPETEHRQAIEEGRDLTSIEAEFGRLLAVPKDEQDLDWRMDVLELTDTIQTLPYHSDFRYGEPNDLTCIRECREGHRSVPTFKGNDFELLRRLHGGLLGRICGCMLGKPYEGLRRADIQIWGEATGNWPMCDYLHTPSADQQKVVDANASRTKLGWAENWTRDKLTCAVEDDDLNYTITGFDIVRKYGADFTANDVAEYWCDNLPMLMLCTAERVAYRNFAMSILPPDSASYRNPYREWIGAQIRADAFGYLNPGKPERAAEWAWRDASISHIKNGIYGEMWVAAMLAAAYVLDDFEAIIKAGLAQIPAVSRLHEAVMDVVRWRHVGKTYEEVVDLIHERWDESVSHDWCHTISNAQIVTLALLYGENDFGLTISRAVMPGFDTDCNGATAGSVWGIVHGVEEIPAHWSEPMNDTMRSHLLHWREIKISDLARQMAELAK